MLLNASCLLLHVPIFFFVMCLLGVAYFLPFFFLIIHVFIRTMFRSYPICVYVCACVCLIVFQTGRNGGVRKRRKCFFDIICWWPTLWEWNNLWRIFGLYFTMEHFLSFYSLNSPALSSVAHLLLVWASSLSPCAQLQSIEGLFLLVIKLQSWYNIPFHKTNKQKDPL